MPDQTTPLLLTQPLTPCAQIPHNLPAEILTAWLRERAKVRFEAVPLPPCFRLTLIRGRRFVGLPMRGWAIQATDGAKKQIVLPGLSEAEARYRAALLNKRTAPTGFHSHN